MLSHPTDRETEIPPASFEEALILSPGKSTHKNRTFFYRVANQDGAFTVNEAWSNSAQGYMSSPVIIGDYAYWHLGNGRLCCIDLRSGKETWRSKPFGKYWSMVVQENRILALDERGELLLIEAVPDEFRLLDRKEVSDKECWAHVAVRTKTKSWCVILAGVTLFDWRSANSKVTE